MGKVGFALRATSKRKLFNKEKRKEKPAETGKRKEKRKQFNKAGGGAGKVFESKNTTRRVEIFYSKPEGPDLAGYRRAGSASLP